MRRAVAIAAALTGLMAIAVPAAGAPSASVFKYGVAAGEVTSTSAILWTRAPKAGLVTLAVAARGATKARLLEGRATREADLTVQGVVRKLKPGTTYTYSFAQGKARSTVGTFTTAPASAADTPVRFAISGDADATPGPSGAPGFNRFEVYARMAAEKNAFNINLGDTIYSDSEVGGAPVARTVRQKW
ncbi:MAG TPA: PhoD-like phosphatase N-terminal domain-containing protein, partial [Gaiellaceae bacterium]|nr:PhoD-like phosphatase N-terminal domain-containing protein [Gaiellaceae bacterium]